MNIITSLSELNNHNALVTDLVPNIYKFTDDYDENTKSAIAVKFITKQSDGKILINSYGEENIILSRLNTDGSIDESFNSPIIASELLSVVVQSNGKIYVGGNFSTASSTALNIVRLNSDGSEDTSFAVGTGFNDVVKKIHLSSNESYLIVAGNFTSYDGTTSSRIAKLNTTNGSLNATFESNVLNNINPSFIDSFDMNDSDDIFLMKNDTTIHQIDIEGVESSVNLISFNDAENLKLKINNENIYVGGRFSGVVVGEEETISIKNLAKFNMTANLDQTFSIDLSYQQSDENVYVYDFNFDTLGNIYIGGRFSSINENNAHFFGKVNSSGEFVEFNDPFDFEERVYSILATSDGSVFVGGAFNKPNFKLAKFNQDGSLNANFVYEYTGEWFGISDGGDDLEDGGNYFNTNLTQVYSTIVENDTIEIDSISNTHVPAYNDTAYDDFNVYGYEHRVTNPNGKVVDGSSYFGSGGEYFTNMYSGMFCLVANNINISEFSVTGNSGSDGDGEVRATSFEISVKGQTYSCFLKSIWGDDPSMNQLIIVDGKLDGLTQLFDTSGEYDDHAIQGLEGRSMLAYLLLCSGGNEESGYDDAGDPLEYDNAEEIATLFIDIVSGYNNYTFEFSPSNKATEGDEGSLDTAILNGKSIQRGYYIETVNSDGERKVSVGIDGELVTDEVQTIGDVLGIVKVD